MKASDEIKKAQSEATEKISMAGIEVKDAKLKYAEDIKEAQKVADAEMIKIREEYNQKITKAKSKADEIKSMSAEEIAKKII